MDAAGPSTPEYNATPSGATKSPCNVEAWTEVKAKQLRNLGQTSTSRNTHREVAARQAGELVSAYINVLISLAWMTYKTHSETSGHWETTTCKMLSYRSKLLCAALKGGERKILTQ